MYVCICIGIGICKLSACVYPEFQQVTTDIIALKESESGFINPNTQIYMYLYMYMNIVRFQAGHHHIIALKESEYGFL